MLAVTTSITSLTHVKSMEFRALDLCAVVLI